MIQHQSYFEGHVQSLSLAGHKKTITVGVMAKGEYEFGTQDEELMQVIAGMLVVLLPNETQWQTFKSGTEFVVPANSRFKLEVPVDTAYFCTYG